MVNKTCYTTIFGNYDTLKDPQFKSKGWNYICYTDQENLHSDFWEIIKVPMHQNPRFAARLSKIMYFNNFDQSIYTDASFFIACDLNDFWNNYYRKPFNAPRHPMKNDVFKEGASCILYDRGGTEGLLMQLADYEGVVPRENGIIQSGILLRDNSKECISLCNDWWKEVSCYSLRDQVGFAKASLNHKEHIHTFDFDYTHNTDFLYIKRVASKSLPNSK